MLDFATPAVFQCTSDVLSCKILIPCFLVCLHQSLKHIYFEIPDNNPLFILSTKLKARFNIILQLEILVFRLLQRELLKGIYTSRHDFSWNYRFSQRLVHWFGWWWINRILLPAPVCVFFPILVLVTWTLSLDPLCMQRHGKPWQLLYKRAGKNLYLSIVQCWHVTVFVCLLHSKLSPQITRIWLFSKSEKELCFKTSAGKREVEKDVGKSLIV